MEPSPSRTHNPPAQRDEWSEQRPTLPQSSGGDRVEQLKRAEAQVPEQSFAFDQLFEQSPEAAAVLTPEGRIVRVNKQFRHIFGYRTDELVEGPIDDLIVPESLIQSAREWTAKLKNCARVDVESVRRRKDGRELCVSIAAVPITSPSGEQIASYVVYRDVTEQKRAEARLRESEARFQEMADTAPVMIWMTGTDALCNYFNKPWIDFTGRTMEQEVGTGWIEGVYPDDVQGCFDGFLPAFHARKPFRMEYRLRRADGEYRWVIESGIPRYTGAGEFAGYIGSNIDITDIKRAESLLSGEKRILEMVAKGASLPEILDSLCQFVEEQVAGCMASILLLEEDRLRHGAAPNIPKSYIDAIDGAAIGPSAGSCGTAAYRGEQVIVEDIAVDRLWADYRDLALSHSLRACWSTPVFSSQGRVVATFAMYYREPTRPAVRELEIIEQITHLAGVAIDRNLALEALRSSEAYLAEAQRLAQLGTWVWRVQGGEAVYLSDEWYRIYGFNPDDGPPKLEQRTERIHPEDRAKWQDVIARAITNKSDYEVEFRILLPTGMLKHVHTVGHPVLNASGELVKFVGVSMDVSERRRIENTLRQGEAYLAEAQRLTFTGSWAFSPALNNMVHWSEETFRIFDLDPQAGPPTLDVFRQRIHPQDRDRVHQLRVQRFSDKLEYVDEYRALLPDGTVKYVRVIGHPVLDKAGEVLEYVGTVVDVTDRKRAEQERERLHQLEADLARINRVSMMGELAASLAHEIKQPIAASVTNAKTCVRWLRRDVPDIAEACAAAARTVSDAMRAADILDRVRSLYGRDTRQRELVDINETIRDMIVLLRDKAKRHSISIQTELDGGLPTISADRVQLQQVLMNLMLNGLEAMKDTIGDLTITSKQTDDGQLLVSVSDSGTGISSDQADRIFEAFFTTKPQGTGMGLSISRKIVESHGGRLWASVNSGPGATFHFTLPCEQASSSSAA